MDRRGFVKVCAGSTALALANWHETVLAAGFESFKPAKLTNQYGIPLKASEIPAGQTMVFSFPTVAVPCFLINLGDRKTQADVKLKGEEGEYTWNAAVGPKGQYVAFVAICTHQLSYPQKEVSYLRYEPGASELAGGAVGKIVCCAHASVFEPTEGAKNVSGPATQPLLPVRLVYDPVSDELAADGVMGMEFIKNFFKTFKSDLNDRYGRGGYRQEVGDKSACVPLTEYSQVVVAC